MVGVVRGRKARGEQGKARREEPVGTHGRKISEAAAMQAHDICMGLQTTQGKAS